ncbi:MAG: glycosyltransferase family 2 protein [Candidatus Sungbacteria bacterium]|nr:glycosyltransferase family 2 protein [Candidatus Sungbacteria bacterium]
MLNIVIPMAGQGAPFKDAGYAFPKPLIDIKGKTMIEVVVNNLRPQTDHKFIFVCRKELQEKYDLYNILKNATNNKFEIVPIGGITEGAACTVLCASHHINTGEELIIANSDQYIEFDINDFIASAREHEKDGLILTFHASHPKWSYARVDSSGKVLETAEKRVISNNATAGIYYFQKGSDFVEAAQSMIRKNIRHNNEFYVCPVYNELILGNKNIYARTTAAEKMHGLGTPEDLELFIRGLEDKKITV